MAIAMMLEFPGLTEEQYAAAGQELQRAGTPAGELFHAGGPMEGGWRIVEGWASQEAADAFYGSAQFRELAATMTPPTIVQWPIAYLENGSRWTKVP
jgi:hypothetical protein